jgi:selenocysteine lyase/cysteine desulfurase
LVDQIIDGLGQGRFDLLSPRPQKDRTSLVVFSHKKATQNPGLFEYLKTKGFYVALWKNKLRVSPHIYNTTQEIQGLINALNQYD